MLVVRGLAKLRPLLIHLSTHWGTNHLSEIEPKLSKKVSQRRCSEVDAYVGKRIKAWREANSLTQTSLAQQIGISFQQLQKYEHGSNRMSAGRLFALKTALGVSFEYFYEGLDELFSRQQARIGGPDNPESPLSQILANSGAERLLREYSNLKSPAQQRKLIELVEKLNGKP